MTSCTELEQINRLVGGSEPAVLNWSFFRHRSATYVRVPTGGLAIAIACLTRCEQRAARHRREENATASRPKFSLWREGLFRPYVLISVGSSSLMFLSFLISFGGCSFFNRLRSAHFSRHRKVAPEILTTILNRFKSPRLL